MGAQGNHGACCQVGERDWILGPLNAEDFARIGAFAIEFEEGSRLFPNRSSWQTPANYPAIRVNREPEHACVFYDRGCTIYESRPQMCRAYQCDHLTAELAATP